MHLLKAFFSVAISAGGFSWGERRPDSDASRDLSMKRRSEISVAAQGLAMVTKTCENLDLFDILDAHVGGWILMGP